MWCQVLTLVLVVCTRARCVAWCTDHVQDVQAVWEGEGVEEEREKRKKNNRLVHEIPSKNNCCNKIYQNKN